MEKSIFDEQRCRICGCTWNNACSGGCYWIEEDLCSKCSDVKVIILDTKKEYKTLADLLSEKEQKIKL